ncbi:AAA-associated domain-containing protein [Archaeoglobus sp.]
MKGKDPRHTIRALLELGLIVKEQGKYVLKDSYIGVLRLGKEDERLKRLFEEKLLGYTPFKKLVKILEASGGQLRKDEIGDYIQAEFNADWKQSTKSQYVKVLLNWGSYADILLLKGDKVFLNPKYANAPIKSVGVENYSESLEKYLYDYFCEKDPAELIREIEELEKVLDESKKSGDKFEEILVKLFRMLGFSVRKHTGIKERSVGLSYDSKEGGDLGLFVHLPVKLGTEIYEGITIAVESKATQQGAPKKAIDQVRTLSKQIKKLYPNYYILKVVVSRSIGFEPYHARDKAYPEVIHLPYDVIKYFVKLQTERFKQNKTLITPFEIIEIMRKAIKEGRLELTQRYVEEILSKD